MKTILIIAIIVSFLIKSGIHAYPDHKNGGFDGFEPASMMKLHYFFPFSDTAKDPPHKEKWLCNFFYLVTIVLVILTLLLIKFQVL